MQLSSYTTDTSLCDTLYMRYVHIWAYHVTGCNQCVTMVTQTDVTTHHIIETEREFVVLFLECSSRYNVFVLMAVLFLYPQPCYEPLYSPNKFNRLVLFCTNQRGWILTPTLSNYWTIPACQANALTDTGWQLLEPRNIVLAVGLVSQS